ncbi:MAG: GTPase ObgE [Myxococcota bacterium]
MTDGAFIDECRVFVQGGHGGQGCVAFRREKFVPRGGPSGGNGGRGGSVVFVANPQLYTLQDVRYRRHSRAERGAHGSGSDKHGRSGADLEIELPVGTLVLDDATRTRLTELLEPGQRWVAAEGGRGGRGNACFATPTQRAPRRAEPGQEGVERWLRLELKLLADVGLVGFPNAGKSTLVSRLSSARPRVAAYPFTTLQPHLGMVERGDLRFVVADIPGLIPGAHCGAGLGQRFLRHVERTRVLLHLLDPEPLLMGIEGRSPAADHSALRHELEAYAQGLAERRELVRLTKADLVPDPRERRAVEKDLVARGLSPQWISAATGEGIDALVAALAREVAT